LKKTQELRTPPESTKEETDGSRFAINRAAPTNDQQESCGLRKGELILSRLEI